MSQFSIIPPNGFPTSKGTELDKKAICFFAACGFFPGSASYWKDVKWDRLDFDKNPWRYQPKDISLDEAVDLFASVFHEILRDLTRKQQVILPLSGGLDSRCLAVGLNAIGKQAHCFSYKFSGSFNETKYGKAIAKALNWPFEEYEIQPGYLWEKLDEAAETNLCYSEFTHPRQLAVAKDIASQGNVWLLGHWGDVLFDDMKLPAEASDEDLVQIAQKKILKKGGSEFAEDLWNYWQLEGSFQAYLSREISNMLDAIPIENKTSKIRAFKSTYWATRWTSVNLDYYRAHLPIALPFYHDKMCKLVMTLPEEHLANRQIQIEYIKKYNPKLAEVTWQDSEPYNLFNYHKQLSLHHLPFRIFNKLKREVSQRILGRKQILRNWEIQFLGAQNEKELRGHLNSSALTTLVGNQIVEKYLAKFYSEDAVKYSHSVSTLLTFKKFAETRLEK